MLDFIKELWWFIRKNSFSYIMILVLGIIGTLLLLIPPMIIANFIKVGVSSELTYEYLIWNILIPSLIVTALIYIVVTSKRIMQARLSIRLNTALQMRYIENILISDASFFEMYQSGDLLTRALGDVSAVRMSGVNRILNIVLEVFAIASALITMLIINVELTLYSIIPLPIIFVVNLFLKKVIKRNWKRVRSASSDMSNLVLESITNMRTLRAFSKEEENCDVLLAASDKVYKIERKNLKVNSSFMPIFQSIVAISTLIAYYFGSKKIISAEFSIDQLIQFTLYLNMLASPLTRIGNMINNFYESLISLDRLNDIYYSNPKVVDAEDAEELSDIKSITFKNFSFKYPNDEHDTIVDLNLTLNSGQTLGIVGKTGSGKSTIVRQLLRQFYIDNSTILVNGESISSFTKKSIREHISYVPQEHILFSRSVMENIRLGSTVSMSDEEVYGAIDMADFGKDIDFLPYGLKTIVGEYGVTLSGGQKQRLSIARAFLKNSQLMILDDSLSAVDGKTESNIISNLQKYRKNKTNIIIAHRLSAVVDADMIIVMDSGKIVESGSHADLMNKRGWYYEQYQEQQMEGDSHE